MDYTSLINNGATYYDLHRTYSAYYTDAKTTSESQKIILSMKFELNLFAGSRNDLEKICILYTYIIYERVIG